MKHGLTAVAAAAFVITLMFTSSASAAPSVQQHHHPIRHHHLPTTQISVTAYFDNGTQIRGMWVVFEINGSIVQAAYTPHIFTVVKGQTYQVYADSWRSIQFQTWAFPPTSEDPLNFANAGNTTADLMAIYS